MEKKIFYRLSFITAYFLIVFATLSLSSCKKFVDVPLPVNPIVSQAIFSNDGSATGAVIGIYSEMMNDANSTSQYSSGGITLYAGMSADELYFYTPGQKDEFVKNQLTLTNHPTIASLFWNRAYANIYGSNACLEGLEKSTGVSMGVKNRLKGECSFIRAFCYFHLVNLFGDVPLVTATDYATNAVMPRTDKSVVYQKIVSDLQNAIGLLLPSYPDTLSKTRPNKWTATALLARVYLYQRDWVNAEAQATAIIESGQYALNSNPADVFLKKSIESIWQLVPVNPLNNTWEGNLILPATPASTPTYVLDSTLVAAFEPGDLRRTSWVGSRTFPTSSNPPRTVYYPTKYKIRSGGIVSEFYTVFRLAELYLIRSEARAQQGLLVDAKKDLNKIRNRAGLPDTPANTQDEIVAAIEKERRIELFAEWGHRWYDLKRTNRADVVLGARKPATWQPTDALWPIPQSQLIANPALTQNPGYQ